VCRTEKLERVQCKYTRSNGVFINVQCRSHSLTRGKVKTTKHYTEQTIDWRAVYDATTGRCYYLPAAELGATGKWDLRLRLRPTLNSQLRRVRFAANYLEI
jgi:hypothetical protein